MKAERTIFEPYSYLWARVWFFLYLLKTNKMKKFCEHCGELKKNCICRYETCSKCGKSYSNWDSENQMFEYRGALGCSKCFDEVVESRDIERQEVMAENNHKTDRFKGLDMGDSVIGKANRKILKRDIEIAKKEGGRTKAYENKND